MDWNRSTYSFANGNCVEVAWRKASGSNYNGSCVEVAWRARCAGGECVEAGAGSCGMVHVRDSKDRAGPVLSFTPGAWTAFLEGVRSGELAA